jgi:hypothetical protein
MAQIIRPTWATSTAQPINQTAHGFTTGQQIYFDGTNWALAQADAVATARIGTVGQVVDANRFLVVFEGILRWNGHGLTVGALYYLSDTVAGGIKTAAPVAPGTIKQPCVLPINANEVRLLEYVIAEGTGGGGLQRTAAFLPVYNITYPGINGFRLRVLEIPQESAGTLYLSWKRDNGTAWSGTCAYSSKNESNGGSVYSLRMLSGDFGWGTIQIVTDGGKNFVELVADNAWQYQTNSQWNIMVDWTSHTAAPAVIQNPIYEATTGTVRLTAPDSFSEVNSLGDLSDVDLTGVS